MKGGTILREFEGRDGRKVTLRTPRWEDLDDMLDFINSLVEEEAMILMETKQTRDQEVDWLARGLSKLEKERRSGWRLRSTARWWASAGWLRGSAE